jgi:hypothetical protein
VNAARRRALPLRIDTRLVRRFDSPAILDAAVVGLLALGLRIPPDIALRITRFHDLRTP